MSVEATAIVFNHSPYQGTKQIILLGIANHDGDGGSWPSIARLARYANVDDRNVRRAIQDLVSDGVLEVEIQAGGMWDTPDHARTNRYRINLACPPECDGSMQHRIRPGGASAPPSNPLAVAPPPPGATAPPRGAPEPSPGGAPAPPKPSLEPPSNRGGARRASSAPRPSEQPPPMFCPDHPTGTTQPCRACAAAAEERAAWTRERDRRRERERSDALRREDTEARRTAAPPPISLLRSAIRKGA